MSKGIRKTLIRPGLGQTLVEFALVLPLVVLLVAGIFDLGRAFFSSITITNAARVGARYGTLHHDDPQGMCDSTRIEANLSGIAIDYGDVTITCNTSVTCLSVATPLAGCEASQPITVTVNHLYDDMVLGFFFPSGVQMQRQQVMIVP